MQILKVTDEAFRQYGKVIKDLDVSDIITAMSETPCPEDVVYEPSIESLEEIGRASCRERVSSPV